MSVSARRLPAEWDPQSAVMLTWPHERSDWGDLLEAVEEEFVAIASAIAPREIVLVVCRDETHRDQLVQVVRQGGAGDARTRLECAHRQSLWTGPHQGPVQLESGRFTQRFQSSGEEFDVHG